MEEQQLQVSQSLPPLAVTQEEIPFVPSSVEKKRALMAYFLFWVMIVLVEKKANAFEFFHLKQAIGWWMVAVVVFVLGMVLVFLPLLRILGILPLIIMVVLFIMCAKQAWDGKYKQDLKGYSLAFFPSLGNWLLSLFDIRIEIS